MRRGVNSLLTPGHSSESVAEMGIDSHGTVHGLGYAREFDNQILVGRGSVGSAMRNTASSAWEAPGRGPPATRDPSAARVSARVREVGWNLIAPGFLVFPTSVPMPVERTRIARILAPGASRRATGPSFSVTSPVSACCFRSQTTPFRICCLRVEGRMVDPSARSARIIVQVPRTSRPAAPPPFSALHRPSAAAAGSRGLGKQQLCTLSPRTC